jgi:FdhD protein
VVAHRGRGEQEKCLTIVTLAPIRSPKRRAEHRAQLRRGHSQLNAPNTPYRPILTDAARPSTFNVAAVDENGATRDTPIAGEHPLTLYVDKREILTLMTLGAAPEALAIGYLRNQRLIDRIEDIVSVQVDWDVHAVAINTRSGLKDLDAKLGKRTTTSGCGQGTVFGGLMDEIDSVKLPAGAQMTRSTLYALLDRVRLHETIYKQAGAVHGCALATNDDGASEILYFVEDVGRHNAVDAIAGRMWLDRVDGGDKIFYTTGRLTSEMVIKAAQMGIPFLVSRSGLTQMGYEIAQKVGITMIGRATGKHFLLFTGGERFHAER